MSDDSLKLPKIALDELNLGSKIAEQERHLLKQYFLETGIWKRLRSGKVNIIIGQKGSGKSAMFLKLDEESKVLLNEGIRISSIYGLQEVGFFDYDNPENIWSEQALYNRWKALITVKCLNKINESEELRNSLLIDGKKNNTNDILWNFIHERDSLKRRSSPSISQITLDILYAKLSLKVEKRGEKRIVYGSDLDQLLGRINAVLTVKTEEIWISIDQLDTGFAHDSGLEIKTLKALITLYLELVQKYTAIKLVLFLRGDIWKEITHDGFRNLSHLTAEEVIKWHPADLKKLLENRLIYALQSIVQDNSDSGEEEEELLNFFEKDTDVIFDLLKDGKNQVTPRVLIHFANESSKVQSEMKESSEDYLISMQSASQAISIVARQKMEKTLFAEYPETKYFILKLENQLSIQNKRTLRALWSNNASSESMIDVLLEIGFMKCIGQGTNSFEIPPFYQFALNITQGNAEKKLPLLVKIYNLKELSKTINFLESYKCELEILKIRNSNDDEQPEGSIEGNQTIIIGKHVDYKCALEVIESVVSQYKGMRYLYLLPSRSMFKFGTDYSIVIGAANFFGMKHTSVWTIEDMNELLSSKNKKSFLSTLKRKKIT